MTEYEGAFAPNADVTTIGKLGLPSGHLVACDPYFCAEARSFSRTVPPGNYEVQLQRSTSKEWGERIAFSRLVIQPHVAVASYELATRSPSDHGRIAIEAGVAAYMDDTARTAFASVLAHYSEQDPKKNYYIDVLQAEIKRSAVDPENEFDLGKWALHRVPGTQMHIAVFASGLGDGWYKSWWGLSGAGEVASLITDFGILKAS